MTSVCWRRPKEWREDRTIFEHIPTRKQLLSDLKRAGIERIREKSIRQTTRLIDLADARGYSVSAPRDPARRGGTVAFDVPHAYEVSQALLARDIIVDYRPGAGIRIAPHFYTSDDELESAVFAIDQILDKEEWKRFENLRSVVT